MSREPFDVDRLERAIARYLEKWYIDLERSRPPEDIRGLAEDLAWLDVNEGASLYDAPGWKKEAHP